MTLHLSARQRAMLQEMGIALPVLPPPAAAPAPAPAAPVAAAAAAVASAPAATPARTRPRPAPAIAPPAIAPPATAQAAAPQPPKPRSVMLAQPLRPYATAQAEPATEPATEPAVGGWLVLLECAQPDAPLAGNAGALLDNMLRALGLQHQPETCVAALLRAPTRLAGPGPALQPASLEQTLAQLQPSMVLLLGLGTARAVLDSRDQTLAQLRAGSHQLADGTLAVVSHDPSYLLRAPQAKAATWLDLSRALALARSAAPHKSNRQGS